MARTFTFLISVYRASKTDCRIAFSFSFLFFKLIEGCRHLSYLFIEKHLTHIKYSVEAAEGLSGKSVHCTSVRTWVQNPRTHRKLDPVVCVCKPSVPAARWESVESWRPVKPVSNREDDKVRGPTPDVFRHPHMYCGRCALAHAHTAANTHIECNLTAWAGA